MTPYQIPMAGTGGGGVQYSYSVDCFITPENSCSKRTVCCIFFKAMDVATRQES